MNQPRRFVLFGLPGSGKSTFAVKLSNKLNIPVHHLDRHMFEAGGKKRDKQEFLALQKAMLVEDSWIIEGCAMSTLEIRFAKADIVIYFHLPRLLCMWRVLKRVFFHDKTLCDTADGCTKVISWEILKYIWNFEKEKRESIEALRKKYPHAEFRIFQTSHDANQYILSM
ncbi:MAG: DNA topology modulation protein [Chlamydiota bacterium]